MIIQRYEYILGVSMDNNSFYLILVLGYNVYLVNYYLIESFFKQYKTVFFRFMFLYRSYKFIIIVQRINIHINKRDIVHQILKTMVFIRLWIKIPIFIRYQVSIMVIRLHKRVSDNMLLYKNYQYMNDIAYVEVLYGVLKLKHDLRCVGFTIKISV